MQQAPEKTINELKDEIERLTEYAKDQRRRCGQLCEENSRFRSALEKIARPVIDQPYRQMLVVEYEKIAREALNGEKE